MSLPQAGTGRRLAGRSVRAWVAGAWRGPTAGSEGMAGRTPGTFENLPVGGGRLPMVGFSALARAKLTLARGRAAIVRLCTAAQPWPAFGPSPFTAAVPGGRPWILKPT